MIPAGSDYAAEAVGSSVEYCELHLPVGILGRDFEAAAGAKDRFLFHAVEQLAVLRPRADDLSGLLRDNVVQGIRLHLEGDGGGAFREGQSNRMVMVALETYLRDTLSRRHSLDEYGRLCRLRPINAAQTFSKEFRDDTISLAARTAD